MSDIALFIVNLITITALGFYLILNLQWYSYRLYRVVLKHHKIYWHLLYFIAPIVAYFTLGKLFYIALLIYLVALVVWYRGVDKKLVFTWRVKRFFILLISMSILLNLLCIAVLECEMLPLVLPLILSYLLSWAIEKYLAILYYNRAKRKLQDREDLIIVAITGSYGKTSMKNFLSSILSSKYQTYMTPRSVNTLGGIVYDINENLPDDCEIYICEAGARERGDILEIAELLEHHFAIVGEVGEQHIEYFKTLENIKRTKLELVSSPRLKRAFVHHKVTDEPHDRVEFFGSNIEILSSTLDGLQFKIGDDTLNTKLLGSFNAINIAAVYSVAQKLGMSTDEIGANVARLKSVDHRLQRIDAGGKIILDDGYNGNLSGISEGIRLCQTHTGRKLIVTPGLVESNDQLNADLAELINKVFDIAIITGSLNVALFRDKLDIEEVIYLEDKSTLVEILAQKSRAGDIVYFANDAPNFI